MRGCIIQREFKAAEEEYLLDAPILNVSVEGLVHGVVQQSFQLVLVEWASAFSNSIHR